MTARAFREKRAGAESGKQSLLPLIVLRESVERKCALGLKCTYIELGSPLRADTRANIIDHLRRVTTRGASPRRRSAKK